MGRFRAGLIGLLMTNPASCVLNDFFYECMEKL